MFEKNNDIIQWKNKGRPCISHRYFCILLSYRPAITKLKKFPAMNDVLPLSHSELISKSSNCPFWKYQRGSLQVSLSPVPKASPLLAIDFHTHSWLTTIFEQEQVRSRDSKQADLDEVEKRIKLQKSS